MIPLDDIRSAAATIAEEAVRTPVLRSDEIDRLTAAVVIAKDESQQRVGAFKFRGAYNCLANLPADDRSKGVVAVSSGNHGAAVACAARLLGIEATVHVPDNVAPAKRALIEQFGARVVLFDRMEPVRERGALQQVEESGATFVHPFENPFVMSGQGTVALELHDQVGSLDVLLVPMSGGGLMAGCASVMAQLDPACSMIGVEPALANDTQLSFAAGHPVKIDQPDTIADGLAVTAPGPTTFAINQELVSDVVTVTEEQLVDAMRVALELLERRLEPSGAATLAALLADRDRFAGHRVGLVLSGGNIDAARFAALTDS
ncbi:MAG: threonine/serine dehydratase [Ilumatobacteraceae bacterium]